MTYGQLGRDEQALQIERDVYSARLKLNGEEHERTVTAATNYAASLMQSKRYAEAKALLRKTVPVARRVLGESHDLALKMRWFYAARLYQDDDASPDDIREAVNMLEELERTVRRVFGGAHPLTEGIEEELRDARAVLDQSSP